MSVHAYPYDSSKDVVGALDSLTWKTLRLAPVGTRVEEDKGTLFGNNGIKVTSTAFFKLLMRPPVNKPGLLMVPYQRRHRRNDLGSP
jgi:hypothetical protein